MLATIPPSPISDLSLGPLTLHVYGLIIGIAIILAMRVNERLLVRSGVPAEAHLKVMIPAVIAGFIGARLYHVVSEPVRYWHDPVEALRVWHGGLGIYGAVAAGTLVAWIGIRRLDGSGFGIWADAAAVALPLAQAIGRWGNYVNQELFGGPTSLPWGLQVDEAFRPASYAGACCFHPTFLYESLANSALCLLLYALFRRWTTRPAGTLFTLYIAGYSVIRFLVEGLRIDDAHSWMGLRQNELVAAALLVCALAALGLLLRRSHARRAS